MPHIRVPGYSNPPSTRVLVTPETRGFQARPKPVKPEPVTGFARPGCTRRVPGCRSSGVHFYSELRVILIGELFPRNFDIFFAQFFRSFMFSWVFFSKYVNFNELNVFASGEFHE